MPSHPDGEEGKTVPKSRSSSQERIHTCRRFAAQLRKHSRELIMIVNVPPTLCLSLLFCFLFSALCLGGLAGQMTRWKTALRRKRERERESEKRGSVRGGERRVESAVPIPG